MKCKICDKENDTIFTAVILNKYNIKYYNCINCGFLQTEEPYWLDEAYAESINVSDTGYMQRNLSLSEKLTIFLALYFDKSARFLDYAGGYGVFVRLMRDNGFDFYWDDKYSKNLVARGFEYKTKDKIALLTSFESFEHFDDPKLEIEKMLKISNNIFFSTNLISDTPPNPNDWWYYGLEHGQHVSFYSIKTLRFIAKEYGLNFYTTGNLHLLTEKKLNKFLFKILLKMNKLGLHTVIKKFKQTRTLSDSDIVIQGLDNE